MSAAGGESSRVRRNIAISKFLDRVIPYRRIGRLEEQLARLSERVGNRRWHAIEDIADYLVGARVPGDYAEFGVFRGDTFAHAIRIMAPDPHLSHMRFLAYDSFDGLPEPRGVDALDGFSSGFYRGQFSFTRDEFVARLRECGISPDLYAVYDGWFEQTLTDESHAAASVGMIAAAWIDVDLYESCVPVLDYLTPRLSVGSVLAFDDWRVFRNDPNRGEQLACRQWLAKNDALTLRELFSFGHHGMVFTVASV